MSNVARTIGSSAKQVKICQKYQTFGNQKRASAETAKAGLKSPERIVDKYNYEDEADLDFLTSCEKMTHFEDVGESPRLRLVVDHV